MGFLGNESNVIRILNPSYRWEVMARYYKIQKEKTKDFLMRLKSIPVTKLNYELKQTRKKLNRLEKIGEEDLILKMFAVGEKIGHNYPAKIQALEKVIELRKEIGKYDNDRKIQERVYDFLDKYPQFYASIATNDFLAIGKIRC